MEMLALIDDVLQLLLLCLARRILLPNLVNLKWHDPVHAFQTGAEVALDHRKTGDARVLSRSLLWHCKLSDDFASIWGLLADQMCSLSGLLSDSVACADFADRITALNILDWLLGGEAEGG